MSGLSVLMLLVLHCTAVVIVLCCAVCITAASVGVTADGALSDRR